MMIPLFRRIKSNLIIKNISVDTNNDYIRDNEYQYSTHNVRRESHITIELLDRDFSREIFKKYMPPNGKSTLDLCDEPTGYVVYSLIEALSAFEMIENNNDKIDKIICLNLKTGKFIECRDRASADLFYHNLYEKN